MTDRRTILYAEDEEGIRSPVSKYLEKVLGVKVESFEDGIALEQRIHQGLDSVALVLTDDKMPRMRGSEFIKRYALFLRTEKVPIILMYAGEKEIGEQALKDGAYTYIAKLATLEELSKTIEEALAF